jgi:hypothetical protein
MRRNMTVRGGRLQGEAKGVPQVECSVCGSVVNKRQTMAVDGVRVCKDHAWTGVQKALWAAQKRGGLPLSPCGRVPMPVPARSERLPLQDRGFTYREGGAKFPPSPFFISIFTTRRRQSIPGAVFENNLFFFLI